MMDNFVWKFFPSYTKQAQKTFNVNAGSLNVVCMAYMASGNKNPYIIMHFLSKEDVANRRQLFSRLVCEIYDGDPPISSKNILMIVTL